jgi:hypothetical protein
VVEKVMLQRTGCGKESSTRAFEEVARLSGECDGTYSIRIDYSIADTVQPSLNCVVPEELLSMFGELRACLALLYSGEPEEILSLVSKVGDSESGDNRHNDHIVRTAVRPVDLMK